MCNSTVRTLQRRATVISPTHQGRVKIWREATITRFSVWKDTCSKRSFRFRRLSESTKTWPRTCDDSSKLIFNSRVKAPAPALWWQRKNWKSLRRVASLFVASRTMERGNGSMAVITKAVQKSASDFCSWSVADLKQFASEQNSITREVTTTSTAFASRVRQGRKFTVRPREANMRTCREMICRRTLGTRGTRAMAKLRATCAMTYQ
mmetsp:Transcript_61774/g.191361  ORF Transcript_61774/g.191361 Transcript_61774/m.191361 type:complete len:207 (+) Transcript_61774:239-859(+)